MKLTQTTLIVIPAAAIAIFAIGCTSKSAIETMPDGKKMDDSQMHGESASNVQAPKSKLAIHKNDKGEIVCPVQGDVIASEEKAFAHQDYKGVRYYFCCGGCPEEFAKDPDKYAKVQSE